MSDEWKFIGFGEGFFGSLLPPHRYIVEHRRTGERRYIWAQNIDDIGRAIAAGNWDD
jgi:hypothetical protein